MRNRKRYWLYGRVASPDKWALETQMDYLRSFAEKYQLNVVGESQDEASGLTLERPGLNDFLEAVWQGQVDALLTKDLTRLGGYHADGYMDRTVKCFWCRCVLGHRFDFPGALITEPIQNPAKNLIIFLVFS